MAVSHITSSASHASASFSVSQASFSWTHTTTTNPRGILVLVFQGVASADAATSVTYDGTTIPSLTGGRAVDTATEPGSVEAFFLGSGCPTTDNPTVVVNRTNNTTSMWAVCVTVDAATDTETAGIILLQENGAFAVQSVDDGSLGPNSVRYAGAYYGGASPAPAGTGSTLLHSNDAGAYGWSAVRETTAGSGARNVGFTQATSDDRAGVHLAIREAPVAVSVSESNSLAISDSSSVVPTDVTSATFVDKDSTGTDVFTTSRVITKPSGVANGDIMVMQLTFWNASNSFPTVTKPSSATLRANTTQAGGSGFEKSEIYIAYVGSDTSWTWSWTGQTWATAKAMFFRDIDLGLDLSAVPHGFAQDNGATTVNGVSLSSLTEGGALAWFINTADYSGTQTHSPPTGYTEPASFDDSPSSGAYFFADGTSENSTGATIDLGEGYIASLTFIAPAASGPTAKSGTESNSLAVSESIALDSSSSVSESNSLAVSDTSAITRIIDVSDSMSLAVSETTDITNIKSVSDSMSLAASEGTTASTNVREFNGTSDILNTDVGGASGMVYGTVATLVKFNTVTGFRDWAMLHTSGGSYAWAPLTLTNFSTLSMDNNGAGAESGINPGTSSWKLIVARKASGTATPRFSVYDYGSSTWTHAAGANTLANAATAPGSGGTIRFNFQDSDDFFGGRIAARAFWSNSLPWAATTGGDTDIEGAGLEDAAANWLSNSPTVFQLFNQASVSDLVLDLSTTGTADEVSRTGTTVITGAPPAGFDFSVGGGGTLLDSFSTVAESNSLAVSESVTLASSSTVTESNSLAISEVATVTVAINVSDSMSLAVSEATATTAGMSVSESNSLSISESLAHDLFSTRTESNSLAVSETTAITAGLTASESNSLAVSDTSNVVVAVSVTDGAALSVSESVAINAGLSVVESNSLAVSEAVQLDASSTVTESNSLAVSESASLTILTLVSVSDSMSLAVSESTAVDISVPVTESNSLAVTESVSLDSTSSRIESNSLAVSESVNLDKFSSVTDTSAISVNDVSSVLVTISVSDGAAISVSDQATMQKNIAVTDSTAVSVSDIASVQQSESKSVSQTHALSVSESASVTIISIAVKAYHNGIMKTATAVKIYHNGAFVTGTVKYRTGGAWS